MKCVNTELADKLNTHIGIIYKISLLYTNNPSDRDDLFQDICFQVCRSYRSYRGDAKFSTWLYRVALNTAITQLRKNKKNTFPEGGLEWFSEVTDRVIEDDQSLLLYNAISHLNEIDRAIIVLWLEENSYDEIANIMGITTSNVSVKLARIKKRLAENIKKLEK